MVIELWLDADNPCIQGIKSVARVSLNTGENIIFLTSFNECTDDNFTML
jgi:two-component SAPR family response regulator